MLTALWLIVLIVAAIALAYANASGLAWVAAGRRVRSASPGSPGCCRHG